MLTAAQFIEKLQEFAEEQNISLDEICISPNPEDPNVERDVPKFVREDLEEIEFFPERKCFYLDWSY